MKTIKELFGVEINEEFDIEEGRIFKNCYFGDLGILVVPKYSIDTRLVLTSELITGVAKIIKHEKTILTEEEHDYLQAVCNPKFCKGNIITLRKTKNSNAMFYIEIGTNISANDCYLFNIDKNLFKGMESHKFCTPEQLDIKL